MCMIMICAPIQYNIGMKLNYNATVKQYACMAICLPIYNSSTACIYTVATNTARAFSSIVMTPKHPLPARTSFPSNCGLVQVLLRISCH